MKWQLAAIIWDFVEALQRSVYKPEVELCTSDLIGRILIYQTVCVCVFAFSGMFIDGGIKGLERTDT